MKKNAKGATVTFKDKSGAAQSIAAERVLIAVGRVPRTENLGLEKSKAKLERGFIQVGPFMETAEPGLYAIGDIVAGMPQLAHAASMEGITCVAKIAGKQPPPLDRRHIPAATYCEPQIGSVGLTEKAAREAGYKVKTGKFPFAGNSKATILGQHEGFIKVVSDEQYGEVLGVHAIGPQATEILAESLTQRFGKLWATHLRLCADFRLTRRGAGARATFCRTRSDYDENLFGRKFGIGGVRGRSRDRAAFGGGAQGRRHARCAAAV